MRKLFLVPDAPEELFYERYERLLAFALQLEAGNTQQAQDLLHDALLQFSLAQPDFGAIQNLDAYLYTTLQNLHVSQVRRSAGRPTVELTTALCDSVLSSLGRGLCHVRESHREL